MSPIIDQASLKSLIDNGYTYAGINSYLYKIIFMPYKGYYLIKDQKLSQPVSRNRIMPVSSDLYNIRYNLNKGDED